MYVLCQNEKEKNKKFRNISIWTTYTILIDAGGYTYFYAYNKVEELSQLISVLLTFS